MRFETLSSAHELPSLVHPSVTVETTFVVVDLGGDPQFSRDGPQNPLPNPIPGSASGAEEAEAIGESQKNSKKSSAGRDG